MEEREKGEIVEEKKVEAEELEVEDNPNRGKSSQVSYLDSNLEEINQCCSTRDSFSESDVHKERLPKAVSYTHLDVYKRQVCVRDRERERIFIVTYCCLCSFFVYQFYS